MRLLEKFLDFVHDKFSRSPNALDLIAVPTADATLRATLSDGTLAFSQDGDETLSIPIDGLTIQAVFDLIVAVYPDAVLADDGLTGKSARILQPPRRYADSSSGAYVYIIGGYQSVLFILLDMFGEVLETAKQDIVLMLKQLYLHGAEDYWLDEYGSYFGFKRNHGEVDEDYLGRIITETIKPKCNNFAIERTIQELLGQAISITDIVDRPSWFGSTIGFNLLGSQSPASFAGQVTGIINGIKAAGTKFDSLELSAADISDSVSAAKLSDWLLLVTTTHYYLDGRHTLNGDHQLQPSTATEIL